MDHYARFLNLFPSEVILLPNKSVSGESFHVAGTPLPGRGLHDEVGCRRVESRGWDGHDIAVQLLNFFIYYIIVSYQ
jgi:hypothetical protein